MSTFDAFKDSPFNGIKFDGQEISLVLTKTSPTTARISWTIPQTQSGCTEPENATYNGIVITLDTTPADITKSPLSGIRYNPDATANPNLHAGDKLGTALIVGAFYDDKATTFVDVTGLSANTAYYASGYAVDNVLRYHIEGVHAYVLDYGNTEEQIGFPARHIIDLYENAQLTDSTGLLSATNYSVELWIDNVKNVLNFNGTTGATYQPLINELNKQIALIGNPTQSNGIPNIGTYYFDTINNSLYQWSGTQLIQKDVIVQSTDPSLPLVGAYWYDTDADILYKWNGLSWLVQNVVKYHKDPTVLSCDDYWFNGTNGYQWDGNVWVQKTLYNQTIDPSLPPVLPCNYYWFDTINSFLNRWDDTTLSWNNVNPIVYSTDPTLFINGQYWYDTTNNLVKQYSGVIWNTSTATINETAPTLPAVNTLWYKPSTEVLSKWNGLIWVSQPIVVWYKEPNLPGSGNVWWNTTLDVVNVWNILTSAWVLATPFIQSPTDPSLPISITIGSLWYNSTNTLLKKWDGSAWIVVTYIYSLTNPITPAINDVWYNTTTNLWYNRNITWNQIYPLNTKTNPYIPIVGDFWYNTTGPTLNSWNGLSWISIGYVTNTLVPIVGYKYFDTSLQTLMEWNGVSWMPSILPVNVTFTSSKDIAFTRSLTGSAYAVILVDINFIQTLSGGVQLLTPRVGADNNNVEPSYIALGIGTDGSTDERRAIIDDCRAELGYPVIDVELTKHQWDICITRALEEARKRGAAYKRGFYFLDIVPYHQSFILNDKTKGLDKIVTIMDITRVQSSFLGAAGQSQDVFGQGLLQQLYTIGSFDLISYEIMGQYIEDIGHLFAQGLQYSWDEHSRVLTLFKRFFRNERILMDCAVEMKEQEIIKDRYLRSWVRDYTLTLARYNLAEIRGKYGNLPGASGNISLNASDLRSKADQDQQRLFMEMENHLSSQSEKWGMAGMAGMVIG